MIADLGDWNWRQHRDETVALVRQRKNVESVEDVLSVWDDGEKPVDVVLVDPLREEGDDSDEVMRRGAEAMESRGCERELEGCRKALIVIRPKHLRPLGIPLVRQSIMVPPVARCSGSE